MKNKRKGSRWDDDDQETILFAAGVMVTITVVVVVFSNDFLTTLIAWICAVGLAVFCLWILAQAALILRDKYRASKQDDNLIEPPINGYRPERTPPKPPKWMRNSNYRLADYDFDEYPPEDHEQMIKAWIAQVQNKTESTQETD